MTLDPISSVTGRIAEIRSVLGLQPRTDGAFGQRLDAAIDAGRTAVSVEEAASARIVPTPGSLAVTGGMTSGAIHGAPGILLAPQHDHHHHDHGISDAAVDHPHTPVSADTPYADLFNEAGARHGIDPILLASVAEVESGFDPDAVSHAGAGGLMQFMPATASEMEVDRFDPASAVDGAARYLARDLDRFGRLELAIAAYNAGPAAVAEHGGIPPFTETQHYVQKVLTALESRR